MTTDQLITVPAAPCSNPWHNVGATLIPACPECPPAYVIPAARPWLELHPVRDVETNPVLERIALAADRFPVVADCGCPEDYGLVVTTQCDLRLCTEHAAAHTCQPCDVHAFEYGEG